MAQPPRASTTAVKKEADVLSVDSDDKKNKEGETDDGVENNNNKDPLYPPLDYSRIQKKTLTKDEIELAALAAEFRNFYRTSPYYMRSEDTTARDEDEKFTKSWKELKKDEERRRELSSTSAQKTKKKKGKETDDNGGENGSEEEQDSGKEKKSKIWTLEDTVEDWMFDEEIGFPDEIMVEFEHLRPKHLKEKKKMKMKEERQQQQRNNNKQRSGGKANNDNKEKKSGNKKTVPAKRKASGEAKKAAGGDDDNNADNFGERLNKLEELEAEEEDQYQSSSEDDRWTGTSLTTRKRKRNIARLRTTKIKWPPRVGRRR